MAQETDPECVFEILDRIGEGSYGSVYKARHKKSNRIVAVKIIPTDSDLNDVMKEITILKECRSEFIVRYYGSYYKDGDLWIVMEYCECGSLSDAINKEENVFSEVEIQYILASILLGISYLHDNKKIHRDIKAGNVLLTRDGKAKLADFGVSAKLDTTISKRNTVIGTPFWMAPEIIQEISYDGRADIWSLGITAIELADGQPPYSNIHPMRAIFMIPNRPPPRLRQNGRWSSLFADFVATCLEKEASRRPTAKELLQHPFVQKVAEELVANRGSSEVMKQLVERLILRKKSLAQQKKEPPKGDADFGNTIVTPSNEEVTNANNANNANNDGTIVLHNHNEDALVEKLTREPVAPVKKTPSAACHLNSSALRTPAIQQETPSEPNRSTASNPSRSKFFPSPDSGVAPAHPKPAAHMGVGSRNTPKPSSEEQAAVIAMMPAVSTKQPIRNPRLTDWMRLRRRGEELRQQFGADFQVLFNSYYAELQRVCDEMKDIEEAAY